MGIKEQIAGKMQAWIIKGQSRETGVIYVQGKQCLDLQDSAKYI